MVASTESDAELKRRHTLLCGLLDNVLDDCLMPERREESPQAITLPALTLATRSNTSDELPFADCDARRAVWRRMAIRCEQPVVAPIRTHLVDDHSLRQLRFTRVAVTARDSASTIAILDAVVPNDGEVTPFGPSRDVSERLVVRNLSVFTEEVEQYRRITGMGLSSLVPATLLGTLLLLCAERFGLAPHVATIRFGSIHHAAGDYQVAADRAKRVLYMTDANGGEVARVRLKGAL